jgi:hypothetical protein
MFKAFKIFLSHFFSVLRCVWVQVNPIPEGGETLMRSNTSRLWPAATIALLGAGLAGAQPAISVNFVGGGSNGTPAILAPSDVAGVVAVSNWNNGNGSGLKDSSGATTAASITWSGASWSNQITATDPNNRMMKGYLDFGSSASVTGVPYATYDVYVYFRSDNTSPLWHGRPFHNRI